MRKAITGAACAALILASVAVSPASAQGRAFSYLIPEGSTIGVNIEDVDSDAAASAKLRQPEGAIVRSVQSGSPASRAGLQAGDVIVEFDGERVRSARQLQRLVQETPANRSVRATIVRNGSRQTLDVSPEERGATEPDGDAVRPFALPNLRPAPALPGLRRDSPAPTQGRLGAAVRGLDGQLASFFGVKSGVLVESVSPNSAAEGAGLKAGDVITGVDGRSVTAPEQLTAAIRDAKPGATVSLTVTRDKKTVELKAAMPAADKPETGSDRIRL